MDNGNAVATLENQRVMTSGGAGYLLATVDSATADASVSVDVVRGASAPWGGLALRMTDASNFFFLRYGTDLSLTKVEAGAATELARSTLPSAVAGSRHRLEAQIQGDRVRVYWDGAFQFQATSSFQQSATKHGLVWSPANDTATALDEFDLHAIPEIIAIHNDTQIHMDFKPLVEEGTLILVRFTPE
jgi:hypothetical protein